MSAEFRVGVIASGRIARSHGRGWSRCEHTKIAAVADTHPEALASYAEDFQVESRYHDYREMLDKEDLDIVSVCSWDPQHAEMTIAACARKPKAVLCEKPMAVSLGEAEAMVVAADRNGVKLAIGHQRRFYPRWREARRLIADGAIGKPLRLWSSVRGRTDEHRHPLPGLPALRPRRPPGGMGHGGGRTPHRPPHLRP